MELFPCLIFAWVFGNVELQVGKWSIFQAYFGKVGFVEWVVGLELSQENSCVMRGGGNQAFQRNFALISWFQPEEPDIL